jgi:DHA1 family 2-module integral membrane pump EmrD-like MFS transporter
VLLPLAVFFVILACTVVVMVTKLLRYLAQEQGERVGYRRGETA